MKLHHIGIVTESIESSGKAYACSLGLVPASEIFHDPIQKVRVQFWRDENFSLVELIEPAAADSPVCSDLKKGGGLNHLCYEVENVERQVRDAVAGGAILVAAPVPAVAFSGRLIAFMYFRKVGLIEFVQAEVGA